MNNSTSDRKPRPVYNDAIIKNLKDKYGFTADYIRKSIAGTRTGTIPLKIADDYKAAVQAANSAIKQKLND